MVSQITVRQYGYVSTLRLARCELDPWPRHTKENSIHCLPELSTQYSGMELEAVITQWPPSVSLRLLIASSGNEGPNAEDKFSILRDVTLFDLRT